MHHYSLLLRHQSLPITHHILPFFNPSLSYIHRYLLNNDCKGNLTHINTLKRQHLPVTFIINSLDIRWRFVCTHNAICYIRILSQPLHHTPFLPMYPFLTTQPLVSASLKPLHTGNRARGQVMNFSWARLPHTHRYPQATKGIPGPEPLSSPSLSACSRFFRQRSFHEKE